ncbi:hypothetical protein V6N13_010676 [Hibiscus sabdariffa]|uniref:Biogenesis of lysosome-related organelles complex 1 subunit 7 n=1 Tax=Hibiscus sabdariffa TaxID=183260 RepID=A0ABR2AJA8_9ROSI
MLTSLIKDFDSKAHDTLASQDLLSSSIDRLTRELDQLLEDAPLPFIMQHAVNGVSITWIECYPWDCNMRRLPQKSPDNMDIGCVLSKVRRRGFGMHSHKTVNGAANS